VAPPDHPVHPPAGRPALTAAAGAAQGNSCMAARYKVLAAARGRFEGSLAQSFLARLKALDFAGQAMLFGGGLLVSLLPFVILLSAFASQRVDDDIFLRLGLDRPAAGIVDHLFTTSPATLNAATATSLIFLIAGMLAVTSSLQQIYEKVFRQDHRGIRDLGRLLTWIVVLCGAMAAESLGERPVSSTAAGGWLAPLVTVAIMTPFFWWTMHFLLAGRVAWRTLLPAAVITGVFYGGLGVFSKVILLRHDHLRQQDLRDDRRDLRHHDLVYRDRGGDHPRSGGRCRPGRPEELTDRAAHPTAGMPARNSPSPVPADQEAGCCRQAGQLIAAARYPRARDRLVHTR
jgi:membrane protein